MEPPLGGFVRCDPKQLLGKVASGSRRPCEHFLLQKIHKVYWSCNDRKAVLRGLPLSAKMKNQWRFSATGLSTQNVRLACLNEHFVGTRSLVLTKLIENPSDEIGI